MPHLRQGTGGGGRVGASSGGAAAAGPAKAKRVPALLALRPATPVRSLAIPEIPVVLQDIEVIASDVKQYDALLGGALEARTWPSRHS